MLFENRRALPDFDPRTGSEDGKLYVIQMARLPHRVEQFLVVKATNTSQETFTRIGLASLEIRRGEEDSLLWPEKTEITII